MQQTANCINEEGIMVERLPYDIPSEGLKKDDYIVTRATDFYNGSGMYILEHNGRCVIARCIELTDGTIQVSETATASSTTMSAKGFCKVVSRKVFARITVEENLPTRAIGQLNEFLMRS